MRATVQTLIALVIVFIGQMLSIALLDIVSLNFFSLALPINNNPWTLILSIYSHAGLMHLGANAFALLLVGLIVERNTSNFRFHTFFIVTGIISALSEIMFWVLIGSETVPAVIGASGAIFALIGYAITGNKLTDAFTDMIGLDKKHSILLYLILAVFVTIITASEGVALIAHATGLFIGAVAGHFKILHTKSDSQAEQIPE